MRKTWRADFPVWTCWELHNSWFAATWLAEFFVSEYGGDNLTPLYQ